MNTIKTTLTTSAVFSEDNTKRYLLKKTWDKAKPSLAIIMFAPSEANAVCLDTTTQLVLNNAYRLGYGSVEILNLFAELSRAMTTDEDSENMQMIEKSVSNASLIVYAPGVGKSKNVAFRERERQVLSVLAPYEEKLNCLSAKDGSARLQHPLSPAVRTWYLSPLSIDEILPPDTEETSDGKKIPPA